MPRRKLLLINKFYHDKGRSGGVGRYLVQEEEDMIAAGWDVIPFATADEDARPSPYDRFFVQSHDYSEAKLSGALGSAMSLVWNREAARNLDALIKETRPDVAHLHNIYHHLSPSILPVLKNHGIPVVMTLHDLRLLCPAIHMLRQGEVCERCKGGNLHQAVLGKCVKESRAASVLAAFETFHQRSRRLYEDGVSKFLCPSDFFRLKYAEWGFPSEKLQHLPNFVDLDNWNPVNIPSDKSKDSYLFFGRLSPEKGLRTLFDAQALWEKEYQNGLCPKPPLQLLVAGSGPCNGNVKARVAFLNLKSVSVLGSLDLSQLRAALGRSHFSIIPSECNENGPMAGLESLAAGIPLVGTDVGGIPEMILSGKTGLVVPPRDPQRLLIGLKEAAQFGPHIGVQARLWAEKNSSRVDHMQELEKILLSVIGTP